MLRVLPYVIHIALLIYALADCVQTDESRIRSLPKAMWMLLILFVPIIGPILWLVLGRPEGGPRPKPSTPSQWATNHRPVAPDDDPAFLEELRRNNSEHEKMLGTWEEDLRRREAELRNQDDDTTGDKKP